MKPANMSVSFSITDQTSGEVKCDGTVKYFGLDYQQVLFVEDKLLGAFSAMNADAATRRRAVIINANHEEV